MEHLTVSLMHHVVLKYKFKDILLLLAVNIFPVRRIRNPHFFANILSKKSRLFMKVSDILTKQFELGHATKKKVARLSKSRRI